MPRYFIEVAYKGTHFNGFQLQPGLTTVQGEINRALETLFRSPFSTTTSSRTDAGVHALQNYLHFDSEFYIDVKKIYNLNALISKDIIIKNMDEVEANAHSRFDATGRKYAYHMLFRRDPFRQETAYYMPFQIDVELMNDAARCLLMHKNFESFSKKKTDVKTFECKISEAFFEFKDCELIFHVKGNRFLRGMVRALTATLLQVGRKKITTEEFEQILLSRDCTRADFSVPAHGLFLERVFYPESILKTQTEEPWH